MPSVQFEHGDPDVTASRRLQGQVQNIVGKRQKLCNNWKCQLSPNATHVHVADSMSHVQGVCHLKSEWQKGSTNGNL